MMTSHHSASTSGPEKSIIDARAVELSYGEMTTFSSGGIMSKQSKTDLRKQYGYCLSCPLVPILIRDVRKSRINPMWISKKPRSIRGESFEGKCLKCQPGLDPHRGSSKRSSMAQLRSFQSTRSTQSLTSSISNDSFRSVDGDTGSGGHNNAVFNRQVVGGIEPCTQVTKIENAHVNRTTGAPEPDNEFSYNSSIKSEERTIHHRLRSGLDTSNSSRGTISPTMTRGRMPRRHSICSVSDVTAASCQRSISFVSNSKNCHSMRSVSPSRRHRDPIFSKRTNDVSEACVETKSDLDSSGVSFSSRRRISPTMPPRGRVPRRYSSCSASDVTPVHYRRGISSESISTNRHSVRSVSPSRRPIAIDVPDPYVQTTKPVRTNDAKISNDHNGTSSYVESKRALSDRIVLNVKTTIDLLSENGHRGLTEFLNVSMGNFRVHKDVQLLCLTTIVKELESERLDGRTYLSGGGLPHVVYAMKTYPQFFGIQQQGCMALACLAIYEDDGNLLISSGASSLLVEALNSFSNDSTLVSSAFTAIRFLSTSTAFKEKFHEDDVSNAVMLSMQNNMPSLSVQRDGCAILSNLAVDVTTNKVRKMENAAIKSVVMAMQCHSGEETVISSACFALKIFAYNASNLRYMSHDDFIFECLELACDFDAVCVSAAQTMDEISIALAQDQSLVDHSHHELTVTVEKYALDPKVIVFVLESLHSYSWSKYFVIACLQMLRSLTAVSVLHCETFVESVTVAELHGYAQQFALVEEIQKESAALISLFSDRQQDQVEKGLSF